MRAVEPPADAAVDDPVLDSRDVVVIEAEAPPNGLGAGEVEHLRSRQSLLGQVDQLRDDAEHGVCLSQRAVGEPDAQIGAAHLVDLVVELDRSERRLDQRRVRLDVRAHHDHVARLERVAVGEQVEDRLP